MKSSALAGTLGGVQGGSACVLTPCRVRNIGEFFFKRTYGDMSLMWQEDGLAKFLAVIRSSLLGKMRCHGEHSGVRWNYKYASRHTCMRQENSSMIDSTLYDNSLETITSNTGTMDIDNSPESGIEVACLLGVLSENTEPHRCFAIVIKPLAVPLKVLQKDNLPPVAVFRTGVRSDRPCFKTLGGLKIYVTYIAMLNR
ncbi:unnamed protein product [Larinioides sclopetarius]|uniref:Uncharacterized protein n=1 Tax=Larinioides sclopetarius TaxID=280406 RepID=A0AAV2AIC9_9ARAC